MHDSIIGVAIKRVGVSLPSRTTDMQCFTGCLQCIYIYTCTMGKCKASSVQVQKS
jgi:hypothetical protein